MLIKPLQNFAHAPSGRAFQIGHVYDVTDKSGVEFLKGNLALEVKETKEELQEKHDKIVEKPVTKRDKVEA